jgi:hypothetical protein
VLRDSLALALCVCVWVGVRGNDYVGGGGDETAGGRGWKANIIDISIGDSSAEEDSHAVHSTTTFLCSLVGR